jgi:RhtB (resistance to homoserine/threonine) family protein
MRLMGVHVWSFVGVAGVLIVAPGPDMVLVTKNAIVHGRRAALATALGVNAGLLAWTIASALGVAALVQASAVAFTVLKLVGGAYLIWLGIQALRSAHQRSTPAQSDENTLQRIGILRALHQGLLSNLANPKIAVLFTSLLPQFVTPGAPVLGPSLLLGGLFVAMTLVWLCTYALVAARAAHMLKRPSVANALDRLTGVVLIGLGVRVATEHR